MADRGEQHAREKLRELIAHFTGLRAASDSGAARDEHFERLYEQVKSLLGSSAAADATFSEPTDPSADTATLRLPTPQPPSGAASADTPTLAIADFELQTAPSAPYTGRDFAGYELLEEIARGGMGVVYRARQRSLNRIVALKMILAGQLARLEDVQRFQAEAEAAARLDHPGIVPIYEVGQFLNQHFFTMAFVEGPSLAELLATGPLELREAAQMTRKIAEAIAYAHEHGLIHRDLKPGNILISPDGEPRVTDFGLAKRVEADSRLTVTGQVLGTPPYMPPEQAAGCMDQVDERSDVYSIGAILYAALVGAPPFSADSHLNTLYKVLEEDPVPPRHYRADIPKDLETICLKCLEKDPVRRYPTAQELADDLRRFLDNEPIQARPLGFFGRISRWARVRPALAATLAGVSLFYLLHLVSILVLRVPGEGGWYHYTVTAIAATWIGGAWLLQQLSSRPGWHDRITACWAAMDVVLFTAVLLVGDGPRSNVLPGYLLLTAGTGLRNRVGLVWLVTALSLCGYLLVSLDARWRRPELAVTLQAMLYYALSVSLAGLTTHLILRRVRSTNERDANRREPRAIRSIRSVQPVR